ncbi:unnamed protein product [Prorocentrum cordatum]|uniref:Uncharacterized protein n=1 Tax=Prorocentrum cordatum TaxID=2364126 RepID=A0ABN9RNM7_9DINO|nr:unnamed protein product [Polarella glacialis]
MVFAAARRRRLASLAPLAPLVPGVPPAPRPPRLGLPHWGQRPLAPPPPPPLPRPPALPPLRAEGRTRAKLRATSSEKQRPTPPEAAPRAQSAEICSGQKGLGNRRRSLRPGLAPMFALAAEAIAKGIATTDKVTTQLRLQNEGNFRDSARGLNAAAKLEGGSQMQSALAAITKQRQKAGKEVHEVVVDPKDCRGAEPCGLDRGPGGGAGLGKNRSNPDVKFKITRYFDAQVPSPSAAPGADQGRQALPRRAPVTLASAALALLAGCAGAAAAPGGYGEGSMSPDRGYQEGRG